MVQFSKLRVCGFKSFVDKTELDITKGLTGIVGPNGCGKSNTVEALRWVMGENSAKRMRGDGMEDVIFAGTSSRPPRNFAEVSVLLDNSDRSAPTPYNSFEEIEVTRRIERDHGSTYKINGKTCRARDVQMLFADTVTGAHSPALVSQGRVTAMINAKPQERRLVLEESAGIAGIYARRHEAELRLRAAEKNLLRLEDLVGSMESRLNALKKQAKQAVQYKDLSSDIKNLEQSIAYLEWRFLQAKIDNARSIFADTESVVAEHTATVSQLTKTHNTQSEDIVDIRKADAELSAALQTQKLALQRLEDQEKELDRQLEEAKEQLKQTKADFGHEKDVLEESKTTLERLEEEEKKLHTQQEQESDQLEEKRSITNTLEEKVKALERKYEEYMQQTANSKAARHSLEQQIAADESRILVSKERKDDITAKLAIAQQAFSNQGEHGALKDAIISLETKTEDLKKAITQGRTSIEEAQSKLQITQETLRIHESEKEKVIAEINALKAFVNSENQDNYRPVLEDIHPEDGFELALSRALGDTLQASANQEAPVVWLKDFIASSDLPSLPEGVRCIHDYVEAPAVLQTALSQIGVVDNEEDGKRFGTSLKPGQSLVSLSGAYWRWDGLFIKPTAADTHTVYLKQKNRLSELEDNIPDLEKACAQSLHEYEEANTNFKASQEATDTLQNRLTDVESELKTKQTELNQTTELRSNLFADIAKHEEVLAITEQELEALEGSLSLHQEKLEKYDEQTSETESSELESVRSTLIESQQALRESIRQLDAMEQEHSRRKARLHAIADERVNLQNRSIRSRERLKELENREEQLQERIDALKSRPKSISSDREDLLSTVTETERRRTDAAHKLQEAENEIAETLKALKKAEGILTESRESRAGSQATMQAGEEQLTEITASIEETFEMSPEELGTHVDFDIHAEELPNIEEHKEQKDKKVRKRDLIGPVNLRAEIEAEQLEQEVGGIIHERDDLVEAIEELRGGINKLNSEARERLMAAFDQVNGHFQKLFTRLYGGGKAHLALIESDDPLESGLEIFAQPPGKTLQSLSLLSGGEQTLASIALIFAMFLTNPSPICVLDEIDAPLDDVNVDRVCSLLEEISVRGKTRFLIITHHRLTMARMDRLYGVTMAERGISQLVSVDLNQQLDFLDEQESAEAA